jgi:hypothetical protein
MRAHIYRTIADTHGEVSPTATVKFYLPGTTTLIPDTLYTSDSGSGTFTNPFTSTNGTISVYLNNPQRVRIGIQLPSQSEQYIEDVDVLFSDFIPNSKIGAASGIASLTSGGKVPTSQLPIQVANGLPTLDGSGKIPANQLPSSLGITTVPSRATVRKTGSSTYASYDAVGNVLTTGPAHVAINTAVDHVYNGGSGGGDVLVLASRTKPNDAFELTGPLNARKGVRISGEWGSSQGAPVGGSVLRAVTGGVNWATTPMVSALSSTVENKADFALDNLSFDGGGLSPGAILLAGNGQMANYVRIYGFTNYGIKVTSGDLAGTSYAGVRISYAKIDLNNINDTVGILVQNGTNSGSTPQRGEIISCRILNTTTSGIDTSGGPNWYMYGIGIFGQFNNLSSPVVLGDYGTFLGSTISCVSDSPWVRANASQFSISANQFVNLAPTLSHYIEVGQAGGTIMGNTTSSINGSVSRFLSVPQDLLAPAGLVVTGNNAPDCAFLADWGTLARPAMKVGANYPDLFEAD